MSESSSDLEPSPHAAHIPDRALSPMTVSLDGLLSAIYCPQWLAPYRQWPFLSRPHHFTRLLHPLPPI
jgi:hypothetical protein